MAQQARSPPARAGSHITREPIPVYRLVTTTCTRVRMGTSIATISRQVCSRKRVLVGKLCNDQQTGVGCRINSRLAGWVRCARGTSVRCEGGCETEVVVVFDGADS